MDPTVALQNIAMILKGKAKAQAFLDEHPHLAITNPKDAVRLVELAMAAASAPRTLKRKPQLPAEVREFRRRLATQDFEKILHTAKTLALCSLPVEPVKDIHIERTAVDERGVKVHVRFSSHDGVTPLPYGNDRAIITWLMTLAKEHGSPKVRFDSAMEFFHAFGMADSGKNYADLREALERISNVVISYGYLSHADNQDRSRGEKLVYDKSLPSRHDYKGEKTGLMKLPGFPSYFIEFGLRTYEELISTPVSIPLEILRRYRSSPTTWDLLNYIVASAASLGPNEERTESLKMVAQFLGSRDKNIRKLKQKVDQLAEEVGEYFNFTVVGRGSDAVVMMRELPPEVRPNSIAHASQQALSMGDEVSTPMLLEGELSVLPAKHPKPSTRPRLIKERTPRKPKP